VGQKRLGSERFGAHLGGVASHVRRTGVVNPIPRLRPAFRGPTRWSQSCWQLVAPAVALALIACRAEAQITLRPIGQDAPGVAVARADTWLDRTQHSLHRLVSRTARTIDSWMGEPLDHEIYEEASGSIALAVLWDEFDGIDVKVRFRVDMPLPQINERLRLFVGRMNRDEFVTEREEPSGSMPDVRGGDEEEDQTLAGFIYSRPEKHGASFSASAGARVRSSELDPYVKTSFRYRRALWGDTLFTLKETVFYQMSEKFGLTSRVDFERMLGEDWRLRWTGSATFSEGTEGARGFSTLTATRLFPDRRAFICRIGIEADTAAEVPLEEFGVEMAYRKSVLRDWLVLELRTSLTWPKDFDYQPRKPSWGFGIGCEMYFGSEEFSSRPVTF
jgi:hypothetical protein